LKRLEPLASERDLRNYLGGFAFSNEYALRAIGPLSGGEKARLVLAAIVRQRPNLLLLDEPTNHLDLQMRHALGVALQGYEGALVVISHDRCLLESVSDKFKLIKKGKVEKFEGDLTDYAKWLLESRLDSDSVQKKSMITNESKKDRRRRAADVRALKTKLTNRVRSIEDDLNALNKILSGINERLAGSSIYQEAKNGELKKLLADQQAQSGKLRVVEQRWLEASGQLENFKV